MEHFFTRYSFGREPLSLNQVLGMSYRARPESLFALKPSHGYKRTLK